MKNSLIIHNLTPLPLWLLPKKAWQLDIVGILPPAKFQVNISPLRERKPLQYNVFSKKIPNLSALWTIAPARLIGQCSFIAENIRVAFSIPTMYDLLGFCELSRWSYQTERQTNK